MDPWGWARLQAGEALTNSADMLLRSGSGRGQWPLSPSADPLARRLHEATALLTAGRDLLQTHYGPAFSRARHYSEWGPVITSPPVTRALLTEIGSLARRIAQQGAERAMAPFPGRREAGDLQRRLLAACQWLWVLDSSVRAARQREPVPQHDLDLLRAIPSNTLPPRQLPSPADSGGRIMRGSDRQRRTGPSSGLGVCGTGLLVAEHDRDIPAPGRRGQHRHQPQLRTPASVPGRPHRAQRVR